MKEEKRVKDERRKTEDRMENRNKQTWELKEGLEGKHQGMKRQEEKRMEMV